MTIQTDTTRDLSISPPLAADNVDRFARPFRHAVEALAASCARAGELSTTFPALLFALATGYATPEKRAIALLLVRGGAPLRQIADLIGLPWWTRRLPPECFQERLQPVMPGGAEFSRRIASLVPADPVDAAPWLARTMLANSVVGQDYALWIARQRRFPGGMAGDISETLLAAWAWYSARPDAVACTAIRVPWSDDISLRRALDEAKAWSLRLDLAVALGTGVADTWFPAGGDGAYTFVPLATFEDFFAEVVLMGNCLDQFADQVRAGRTRVFSIRKGGRPVADVEIGAREDDVAIPYIVQLRGPRNRRAGPEIWQATLSWLAAQSFRPLPRVVDAAERSRRQQTIRVLWRPLMDAVKGTPMEKRFQALAFGKEISRAFRAFQGAAVATDLDPDTILDRDRRAS